MGTLTGRRSVDRLPVRLKAYAQVLSMTTLVVIGYLETGCAEMKERAIRRRAALFPQVEAPVAEEPVPVDRERETAVLLLGAATRHLERCEFEKAGQDVERTVAFYEGRSWVFDVGYARALIARGRLRLLSNDNAAAASDFNKSLFILSRRELDNVSLMLGASLRLADCYGNPDAKEQQRAVIDQALGLAARRLGPVEDAKANEIEGYSSVLSLVERYDLVAEPSAASRWHAKFDIQHWTWGEPWNRTALDSSKEEGGLPSCRQIEKVPDAPAVAEQLQPLLRRCLHDAAKTGSFQGVTHLWAHVAADGSIPSLRGISIGIPTECNACITRAISSVRFKPPGGGSLDIEFPISYAVDPVR